MRDPEKEYENAQDVMMEMKARDEDTTDEDMTNKEAAKWIQIYIDEWNEDLNQMKGFGVCLNEKGKKMMKAIEMGRDALKRTEKRTETHACDYINRKDAIDAHYEYCNKHPDAGFPVWSLKILEDLPSVQPDLSGYSDKLWKAAYERGRAEALAEIVRCKNCKYYRKYGYVNGKPKFLPKCTFNSIYVNADDFCSRAERRTDEADYRKE